MTLQDVVSQLAAYHHQHPESAEIAAHVHPSDQRDLLMDRDFIGYSLGVVSDTYTPKLFARDVLGVNQWYYDRHQPIGTIRFEPVKG
jgi:hypothetical protein